jgi:hypothetical protein
MAKIVFPDWKSCCIQREIGVKKRHANSQVVARGLRGGYLCQFHFRPCSRHSGAGRPARGFGPKNGRIGQATNPSAASCRHAFRRREGATSARHSAASE